MNVSSAGLMLTAQGPRVLEYNCRLGDPETQPLLMRLQSDLVDLLEATVDGKLDEIPPPVWDTALCWTRLRALSPRRKPCWSASSLLCWMRLSSMPNKTTA